MQVEFIKPYFEKALINLGISEHVSLLFEPPKVAEHGDLSTNIAMQLAGKLKQQPRKIAEAITGSLELPADLIENVSIAGPGFINIKFTNRFYTDSLDKVIQQGGNFGRNKRGGGKKINVEYVSVNPTGLLHLGHGRNAVIGDTVANLYEWCGWKVTREYYFNNAGNQMKKLADSIYSRYMQSTGSPDFPFPEDGYHGEYIKTIADDLIKETGHSLREGSYQDLITIRKFGENWCFEKIKTTLNRMNVRQDEFYNEDSLYKSGKIQKIIDDLKALDLVYEKDGATWLALSKMGLQDDRVIVKSSGEPTYRLPDIAYHREKFLRGYDMLVDVFGADHIATIPDVLAAMKALGYDSNRVKVLIHQFVTIFENGEQVKMSKRTGKSYTLDDLLDEVGADVVRFFLLMRAVSTHLEFDLTLAREQSDKNPVFYLQYAHARICSVFENAREKGINTVEQFDLSLLVHPTEINLIKTLLQFPDTVAESAEKFEPHRLCEYLRELASAFHVFYHECRILGTDENLMYPRLKLIEVVRYAMRNGLHLLGVSAPEKM